MGLHDRDWFKEDQDQRLGSGPNKSVDDWLAESRSRPARKAKAGSKSSSRRFSR